MPRNPDSVGDIRWAVYPRGWLTESATENMILSTACGVDKIRLTALPRLFLFYSAQVGLEELFHGGVGFLR